MYMETEVERVLLAQCSTALDENNYIIIGITDAEADAGPRLPMTAKCCVNDEWG